SHTRTTKSPLLLSPLTVARYGLAGQNTRLLTGPLWPVRRRISRPVAASCRTTALPLTTARERPSGLYATSDGSGGLGSPRNGTSLRLLRSQTLMRLSELSETNRRPSG